MSDADRLDNAVWRALRGPHRRFALPATADSRAYRYRPDIAPFAALDDVAEPKSWAALAEVVRPGEVLAVPAGHPVRPRSGWMVTAEFPVNQMVAPDLEPVGDATEIVPLTKADVPEMLELVELTKPGPFGPATIELGGYLGIRTAGRLVAMAGRRFRPPGWCEVSAVCTHPDFRGKGLSRRLVAAVTAGIQREGDRAFLHVAQSNTAAVALYRSMGFARHADVVITVVQRG